MEPENPAGPWEEAQGGNDRPAPVWDKVVTYGNWCTYIRVGSRIYTPVHLVVFQEFLCSCVLLLPLLTSCFTFLVWIARLYELSDVTSPLTSPLVASSREWFSNVVISPASPSAVPPPACSVMSLLSPSHLPLSLPTILALFAGWHSTSSSDHTTLLSS